MKNFIYAKENVFSNLECEKIIELWNSSSEKWHGPSNRFAKNLDTYYLGVSVNANNGFWTEKLHLNMQNYVREHSFLMSNQMDAWMVEDGASIKKFQKGKCYEIEHCEHSFQTPHRVLVWMVYLNTIKTGGETFWPQLNYKTAARQGKLVIWPAAWPWSHKGLVANNDEKYIFGGWCSFNLNKCYQS